MILYFFAYFFPCLLFCCPVNMGIQHSPTPVWFILSFWSAVYREVLTNLETFINKNKNKPFDQKQLFKINAWLFKINGEKLQTRHQWNARVWAIRHQGRCRCLEKCLFQPRRQCGSPRPLPPGWFPPTSSSLGSHFGLTPPASRRRRLGRMKICFFLFSLCFCFCICLSVCLSIILSLRKGLYKII